MDRGDFMRELEAALRSYLSKSIAGHRLSRAIQKRPRSQRNTDLQPDEAARARTKIGDSKKTRGHARW